MYLVIYYLTVLYFKMFNHIFCFNKCRVEAVFGLCILEIQHFQQILQTSKNLILEFNISIIKGLLKNNTGHKKNECPSVPYHFESVLLL